MKKFRKYLLLLPLVYLCVAVILYSAMTSRINNSLLTQKYNAAAHEVDIISDTLNRLVSLHENWGEYEYTPLVTTGAEYIDNLPKVYGAAFVDKGDVLQLVSERNDNVDGFDPTAMNEFQSAVRMNETGTIKLQYSGDRTVEFWLYYRWMPSEIAYENRYLVVAAVSLESIVVPMAGAVTAMSLVNISVTLAVCVAGAAFLIRLGVIWDARETQPGVGKWRQRYDKSK